VTRVDVKHRHDFYAVYECMFTERGKKQVCFISEDTDQHISGIETSPRQRLLDSIAQDCDYDHIDYLVKSSNMDVSSFVDLVLEKIDFECKLRHSVMASGERLVHFGQNQG
jgi:hypothetical protein